jgi:aspartate-semialdehyde dehydrogenase
MAKKEAFKIAVVGATGNVGRAILSILAERGFPAANISAVASERSANTEISYGEDHTLKVQPLTNFDFSICQLVLFSPGGKVSAEYAPKAAAAGCVVIDNTSHFRMDKDVPLVVPEINAGALKDFRKKNIIANPNCSTIQLVMALNPLHELAPIKRVVVSTYQSVSGAGKEAMDELFHQTRGVLVNDTNEPHKFVKPIAFNVIPQIDPFMEDGFTKEEWKMAVETRKIMDAPILVTATCVRVPVFIGHAVSANIEFSQDISVAKARQKLRNTSGVRVIDSPDDYQFMTPIECAGDDEVYISRIRADKTVEHGLSLWIVADNIRKGAALNAVQIAEYLIQHHF